MDIINWTYLPDHILTTIFSFLDLRDRHAAGNVCQSWREASFCSNLWRSYTFKFNGCSKISRHRLLHCIDKHGEQMHNVTIEVNQAKAALAKMGHSAIHNLSLFKSRKLRSISVAFTNVDHKTVQADGVRYVEALSTLFSTSVKSLQVVDLSRLAISYTDALIDALSEKNRDLRELRIDCAICSCTLTHPCVARLIRHCPHLHTLDLYECSITEETLRLFSDQRPSRLQRLSLTFHGEGTFVFSQEMWTDLVSSNPSLCVSLRFDHDCPLTRVYEIVHPGVPVTLLCFKTYTYIDGEINWAVKCLKDTLQVFHLKTPLGRNAPELNAVLIRMAEQCRVMKALYVECALDKTTVDKMLELMPNVKKSGKYLLTHD